MIRAPVKLDDAVRGPDWLAVGRPAGCAPPSAAARVTRPAKGLTALTGCPARGRRTARRAPG